WSAVLRRGQGGDTTPYCRHPLADGEIEACHEGRVNLPTAGRQHVLDPLECAEHHAVLHGDETPAAHGLDHLRIEQLGQGHPARLGRCSCGLTAWELHPLPIVRE